MSVFVAGGGRPRIGTRIGTRKHAFSLKCLSMDRMDSNQNNYLMFLCIAPLSHGTAIVPREDVGFSCVWLKPISRSTGKYMDGVTNACHKSTCLFVALRFYFHDMVDRPADLCFKNLGRTKLLSLRGRSNACLYMYVKYEGHT